MMKPVSKTAFFCCGARMLDTDSDRPVCGDNYAKKFMDKEALEVFDKFRPFKNAIISNATRHRIIDDLIKSELKKEPETKIFIIGAGFDTRAYRMDGGYWYEFDDPEVIKYKEKYLPESECKNTIKRIPFDFSVDSLEEKLTAFNFKKPVFIIIEGVFIYLDEKTTIKLIRTLQNQFSQHTLFCDLQNYKFFKKFNTKFQKSLQEFGASLQITSNSPEQLFLDSGYALEVKISIIDKTLEYAKLTVSQLLVKILMKTVFKNIKDGYAIYVFKHITPAIK